MLERSERLRSIVLRAALLGVAFIASVSKAESPPTQFNEFTIAQFQALMAQHRLTSRQLTEYYLERIDALDQPDDRTGVNSIIEVNPDALGLARHADALRAHGQTGPLLGIPVLLKDNIDTGDQMQTTAGSFALFGSPATSDSTVAAKLRAAGAVILGKTNLSEWANFRSFFSVSGWSAVGGQTHNPYGLDRNPCGSSSGSGAAESANFATLSFGTETDGSIVCPANASGVVGIKPTVGLTSRAGVVPISHTQDTVGPHGRTVADAAIALGVIQSRTSDGRDPATEDVPLGWQGRFMRPTDIPTDYTQFLNKDALRGKRLGLVRTTVGFNLPSPLPAGALPTPAPVVSAFDEVLAALTAAGAIVVDLEAKGFTGFGAGFGAGESLVLDFDFRIDVAKYFATRQGVPLAGGTLQTAIDFNNNNADAEMPFFNQDIFLQAQSLAPGLDDPQPVFGGMTYNQALAMDKAFTVQGIDGAITQFHLDAVIAPTDNPAWSTDLLYGDHFVYGSSSLGAAGGYPYVQVPAANVYGIPMGLTFFGTAFSEPKLIALASGFEAVTHERVKNLPKFTQTIPDDHIAGEPLNTGKHDKDQKPEGWRPHHM